MRSTHRFFSRWQNWLGLLLVFFFIAVAIAAPVLSPQDPENPGTVKIVGSIIEFTPKPPSATAPLGTLSKSISVYHSLVWGSRSALTFGLLVVAFTALIGALIGASSAYFGGFLNNFLMRIADSFLAFPMIAAVVFITQLITIWLNNVGVTYFAGWAVDPYHSANSMIVVPPHLPWIYLLMMKINPVMVAFILFSWMPYARLMNTSVTQIKNTEYIIAAKSIGRPAFSHHIQTSAAQCNHAGNRDGSQGCGWCCAASGDIYIYWTGRGFTLGSPACQRPRLDHQPRRYFDLLVGFLACYPGADLVRHGLEPARRWIERRS